MEHLGAIIQMQPITCDDLLVLFFFFFFSFVHLIF